MQELHLYEYAVIRFVPKVEREEFMNVGVILYCASKGFLKIGIELNPEKLLAFAPGSTMEEVEEYLLALRNICNGGKNGGPIGQLGKASRFRWITANRSTIIQTSRAHPGLCEDPDITLDNLMQKLVL